MANRTVTIQSSGGDYTSLNAAFAGEDDTYADLVTNTMILTFDCYNIEDDHADQGTAWTSSSSYYLKVVSHDANNGVYSTNSYRIVHIDAYGGIRIQDPYIRIIGIQVTTSNVYRPGFFCDVGTFTIDGCILKGPSSTDEAISQCILVYIENSGVANVVNNIMYDWNQGFVSTGVASQTVNIFNNTLVDFKWVGIYEGYCGVANIKNNLVQNCAEACYSLGNSTTLNTATNISDDTSSPDAAYQEVSITFSGAASDDFHLASGDTDAIGDGTNLYNDAGYPFQTDIDGDDRGGSGADWDIGADEYVSAGGKSYGTVWGYQTPTGYTGESWTTWKTSAGGSAVVSGDADWGKLDLTTTNHYGPVKDTGNSRGKRFVVKRDSIGTGSGTVNLFIRGSTTSFAAADGSPSWEAYSAPINRVWRYVQVKTEKV